MKNVCLLCCEKVITDANGQTSLIGIIQGIKISVVPQSETPANAVVPNQWAVFAVWQTDANEAGKEFVQMFHILWPNGSEFIKTPPLKFKPLHMRRAINYIPLHGMPVGQKGDLIVRSWVEDGAGIVMTEIIEYKILVEHEPLPVPTSA